MKYFRSCFLRFFERENMDHSVHSWWKKYVIVNTMSVKNVLLFYNLVFQMWHYHLPFSCSKYSFVQNLRCSQWWGFKMWSGLGHHIAWYQKMAIRRRTKYVLTKTSVPTNQITWSHNQNIIPYFSDHKTHHDFFVSHFRKKWWRMSFNFCNLLEENRIGTYQN